MKIHYSITKEQRKKLVEVVGKVLGKQPVYCGAPTFATRWERSRSRETEAFASAMKPMKRKSSVCARRFGKRALLRRKMKPRCRRQKWRQWERQKWKQRQ